MEVLDPAMDKDHSNLPENIAENKINKLNEAFQLTPQVAQICTIFEVANLKQIHFFVQWEIHNEERLRHS